MKYIKGKTNWLRTIYIIGIIALIIGAFDPLEGSMVIVLGSGLITLSFYMTRDRHYKIFLVSLVMIIFGVFFLFFFSSLGGFGGTSKLSWWWATLILVYPIGWLISIINLVKRAINSRKTFV